MCVETLEIWGVKHSFRMKRRPLGPSGRHSKEKQSSSDMFVLFLATTNHHIITKLYIIVYSYIYISTDLRIYVYILLYACYICIYIYIYIWYTYIYIHKVVCIYIYIHTRILWYINVFPHFFLRTFPEVIRAPPSSSRAATSTPASRSRRSKSASVGEWMIREL